ncbi:Lrp/AsnC ligand binding domain-containing protein [Desulfosoma sp.]|uniref:Lrp/AsnC ligand binding domain-containing protein n=1 Tax=Desulfosoma sp. TaxID=2603217 RepID=UPI004049E485
MKRWLARLGLYNPTPREPPGAEGFHEWQREDGNFECRDRGLRTVPLAKIVGSVGRYQDFDERFRLKSRKPSERLEQIKNAMRQGAALPPVKLWQIRDVYYVEDGNHRVAAAKALGHDEILAHIVEFIPSGDNLRDAIYRQRAHFLDVTGLHADISLTEPGQYDRLLSQIQRHREYLQERERPDITLKEGAADWYLHIYRHLTGLLSRARLAEGLPGRTTADLYAYVSVRLWEKGERRQYGIGLNDMLPDDMEAFREKMKNADTLHYPEMQRTITAFVLMNVQAKKENRIVEKLLDLEEVREVHSVFGDVDLLVKVQLHRDLLSSDAETISQFVHENIRQLPGVIATKTLIPGTSRIKN